MEELKKQNAGNTSLLPGISSVTMEASMIMSNIQRIIQVSVGSLTWLFTLWTGAYSIIPNGDTYTGLAQMYIHPCILFVWPKPTG